MTSSKFCFSSFFAGDINDDDQLLKTPDETSGSTNLYLYHVSTVVNVTNVFTLNDGNMRLILSMCLLATFTRTDPKSTKRQSS